MIDGGRSDRQQSTARAGGVTLVALVLLLLPLLAACGGQSRPNPPSKQVRPVPADRYPHPEYLADTAWLAARLADPAVRIVDLSPLADYRQGHIPGAVHVWWTPTIRGLQARFRCYALDFVRFERWSERGRVPLPHAGAYVEAWLGALGLERTHVVAHSMGAYAAVSLAARSPHRIDRLVLVAPAGLLPQRLGLGDAGRALGFLGSVTPSLAPVLAVDTALTGPLRFLRSARELARAEPPDLSRISAPTLLVWGLRDRLVPPATAALLRERIPGARVVYLDGARHVPMFERPDACNDAIARFLAGEAVGES